MEQGLYLFTQNIWHGGFQNSNHQVVDANDPWEMENMTQILWLPSLLYWVCGSQDREGSKWSLTAVQVKKLKSSDTKPPKFHLTEKFYLATQGQNSGSPQRGFPSSIKGRFSHAYKRGEQNRCQEDNTPSKSGSNQTNWNDVWFTRPCTTDGTWSCLRSEGKQPVSNDCFRHT